MEPQHTFGGSALNSRLFDFEPDEGIGDGGLAPADPPADPGAGDGGWSGITQEQWEQHQTAFTETQQALQYIASAIAPQQQQPAVDPYADDFQSQLDQYLEQRLSQHLAPVQQFQNDVQMGEANERAMDILTDIQTREGEFLLPDSAARARSLANDYVPAAIEKHGQGPKAAEAALKQAYDDVKSWEQQVGKAYYEREINQIRGLSGAPREPGTSQASTQAVALPSGGKEMDLVRSYFPGGLPAGR